MQFSSFSYKMTTFIKKKFMKRACTRKVIKDKKSQNLFSFFYQLEINKIRHLFISNWETFKNDLFLILGEISAQLSQYRTNLKFFPTQRAMSQRHLNEKIEPQTSILFTLIHTSSSKIMGRSLILC